MLLSNPKMTWQERVWGYRREVGNAIGISTGYFLWHLGQAILLIRQKGTMMLVHGICAMTVVTLGFVRFYPSRMIPESGLTYSQRPFVNYYTPAFLSIEISNVFFNVQRILDFNGMKHTRFRACNRVILLVSWIFFRLLVGSYYTVVMGRDLIAAVREPAPRIPSRYLLTSEALSSKPVIEHLYNVPPLPVWMAVVQLLSFVVLIWQSFHWLKKLLKSGEIERPL
jgi:hypothetical protein